VRRALRGLLPPLAAFAVAHGFLCLVSAGTRRPPWEPGSWSGPDSAHYLSIAKGGYTLFPCDADDPPPGHCGNAGWMPLYPWLMRPLLAAGVASPRWIAAGVAAAGAIAALWALWALFLSSWPRHGGLALAIAAFFPGQVYLHGAFPMGLLVGAVLVSLHAALRGRFVLAGVAGAAAALAHSVGWLLAPVLLAWAVAAFAARLGEAEARRVRHGALLAATLTVAGLATLFVWHAATVGAWDAYLRVQGGYGHHLGSPLATWRAAVRPLLDAPWEGAGEAPAAQAALTGLLACAAIGEAARRRDPQALLAGLYVAVLWLVPLGLGGSVSVYRTDTALLPGVVLARDAPRAALVAVLAGLVPVAWGMARLFFELRLV
jgi:hypothetical protein